MVEDPSAVQFKGRYRRCHHGITGENLGYHIEPSSYPSSPTKNFESMHRTLSARFSPFHSHYFSKFLQFKTLCQALAAAEAKNKQLEQRLALGLAQLKRFQDQYSSVVEKLERLVRIFTNPLGLDHVSSEKQGIIR
jgi:hypothetical protein